MKTLFFSSVLATFSDFFITSGTATLHSTPLNEGVGISGVISADSRPGETPRSSLSSNSTLFRDIVMDRELFIRFDFGGSERDILCGVNREVGRKGSVGLLLLEPSGILKSLVIDRTTLTVIHKKVSIPRKELRTELTWHGVPVSDVRLIARRIVRSEKSGRQKVPGAENSNDRTRTTIRRADRRSPKHRGGAEK
jgi:hypothetical protein